jgi:hypothetical protein
MFNWLMRAIPLDKTLFRWDKHNTLSARNLLAGGIHAFGRTDGGKTSSMVQIARAIMRFRNSSMLILCAKKGEYRDWLKLARQCGRKRDVVLIDPKERWRFNMFGYEAKRKGEGAGIAQNVTRFLMELRNVVFRESEQQGGESQQWKKQDERLITLSVIILQLAGEDVTPGNLHALIESAPRSAAQLTNEEWQKGYCNSCLARAFKRPKRGSEDYDFNKASSYFTRFWPNLADRTRSSIEAGTMATLAVADTGICREMFADRTNITPRDAIERRKIVIVNMPPDEWGDVGAVANIGWKYHWQNDVLRREITRRSPITCIWGDESSLWVTPSDAHYLSRCRSYRGCMVYICQSLNSYRQALPGDKAEAGIESMLGNFSHKLFFALGDYDTAEWASNLCGKELRQFSGGGLQHGPSDPFSLFKEQPQFSSNFHESYEQVIQPSEFMNGLRTGSPVNRYKVDAVLVRSGVPFSNGLPFLDVTFDQRKS